MTLQENYIHDLKKSYNTPLLIELNKKDLNSFGNKGLEKAIFLSENIFNTNINKDFPYETNLIYINGDNYINNDNKTPIILLNKILDITSDSIQSQKNMDIVKSTFKGVVSYFTGGLFKDIVGKNVNYGIDQISELLTDKTKDILEYLTEEQKLSEKIVEQILKKANTTLNDTSENFLDQLVDKKLHLSADGKKMLLELSNKFNDDLTALGIFSLIIQLILATAKSSRKIIFINNPHKLDYNSLAILSLFFSFAKNLKEKNSIENSHLGVSVIYCFSDEEFQPYKELKNEKYKSSKKLLDEQRRFTQRYAMLERPSSDIPNIAVKSSIFIGRDEELKKLINRFDISKEDRNLRNLEVIVADPGIGKTKLVEKHIQNIREKNGQKIIQLTLLNQVGHSSLNTGLSSLKDSILKEANRLATLKTMESKLKKFEDKIIDFVKDETVNYIENLLGINNIIDTAKKIDTAINHSVEEYWLKEKSSENLNKKTKLSKEEEFRNIINAILQLQKLSDESLPIVLFIDDIQWIDDSSSEFILKYFTKTWLINSYLVATQRKSDATTSLKLALKNKSINQNKIFFLRQAKIEIEDQEILDNPDDYDLTKLNVMIHSLKGLDEENLTELISLTVNLHIKKRSEELKQKDKILAKAIIKYLVDSNNDQEEVNTLFAIETINILCDKKLYQKDFKIGDKRKKIDTQFILQNPTRYNDKIIQFDENLSEVFELLKSSHEDAFKHLDWEKDEEGKPIQKFNLMAYAVLEERLYILHEYFDEYGNAAVNTLLLSSLLGAPFSSDIIKNVIKAINETKEPLLEPIKKEFIKGSSSILEPIHYDIMEEIYEILSRYVHFNSTYSYKHNLLEIFLDKQLDYLLKKSLTNSFNKSKDLMFELIISIIDDSLIKNNLSNKIIGNLNKNEFQYLLFHLNCKKNILKKSYLNNHDRWEKPYIDILNYLGLFFASNFNLEESNILLNEALDVSKKFYKKNPKNGIKLYVTSLINLTFSLDKNNKIEESKKLYENTLELVKKEYEKTPLKWSESYINILNNFSIFLLEQNNKEKSIKLLYEALNISKKLYQETPDKEIKRYTTISNNLAFSLQNQNKIEESKKLYENTLELIKKEYKKTPLKWSESYLFILNNFSTFLITHNDKERTINLLYEAIEISNKLYDKNPKIWLIHRITALINLANALQQANRKKESIELCYTIIELIKEDYQKKSNEHIALQYVEVLKIQSANLSENNSDKALELLGKASDILFVLFNNHPYKFAKYLYLHQIFMINIALKNSNFDDYKDIIQSMYVPLFILKLLLNRDPELWIEEYNNLINQISKFEETINYQSEEILEHKNTLILTKNLSLNNPNKFLSFHINLLKRLYTYYYYNKNFDESIILKKELLEIYHDKIKIDGKERDKFYYIDTLDDLAKLSFQKKQFQEASDYYETFFKFDSYIKNIDFEYFIVPFTIWYNIVENYLQDSKKLILLEKTLENYTNSYKTTLKEKYRELILEIPNKYRKTFTNEELDIYYKIIKKEH